MVSGDALAASSAKPFVAGPSVDTATRSITHRACRRRAQLATIAGPASGDDRWPDSPRQLLSGGRRPLPLTVRRCPCGESRRGRVVSTRGRAASVPRRRSERRVPAAHGRGGCASPSADRVARDLHDGFAQDLAFIAAHGVRMAPGLGARAFGCGCGEARTARYRGARSAELSDPGMPLLATGWRQPLTELRDRFQMAIAIDAESAPTSLPIYGKTLEDRPRGDRQRGTTRPRYRTFSCRFGQASDGLALRVVDDGCGIRVPMLPLPRALACRSMRERAAGLGGRLDVRAARAGRHGARGRASMTLSAEAIDRRSSANPDRHPDGA